MRHRSFWHACHTAFEPAFAYAESGTRGARRRARHWAREAHRFEHRGRHGGGDGDFFGAALGVRRPLRFLSHRLDLSEEQTAALARILEHLKLERAQAALDLRRAASTLADAFAGDFGRDAAEAAAAQRAEATRRAQDAVAKALEALHALLDPEQRSVFAELVRTGTIQL